MVSKAVDKSSKTGIAQLPLAIVLVTLSLYTLYKFISRLKIINNIIIYQMTMYLGSNRFFINF